MSAATFRAALARQRDALDLLGRYRGPSFTGWPDTRHRQADAILGALLAGDTPDMVAADYLPDDIRDPIAAVLTVALATLAADRRLHGLTRDQEWREAKTVYGDAP